MAGLGALLWVILTTAFFCIPLALSLWALLDCAKRPRWAWAMTTRSQPVWMATILCGILVMPVGLVVSCYYLLRIRPQIADVEDGKFPGLTDNTELPDLE